MEEIAIRYLSYVYFQARLGPFDVLNEVFTWFLDDALDREETFWNSTLEERRPQINGAAIQAMKYFSYHLLWDAEKTSNLKPTDPTWEWQIKMIDQEGPCFRMYKHYEAEAL